MEVELTTLDTTTVEAEWLRELLMDLPIVEKRIPAILMNCDNQTVIVKVNSSKDNMKSSRHVKRRLKSVRKLRNTGVIALDYIHTSKNMAESIYKWFITYCDRSCIYGIRLETHVSLSIVVTCLM
jgi:hypothetical protein